MSKQLIRASRGLWVLFAVAFVVAPICLQADEPAGTNPVESESATEVEDTAIDGPDYIEPNYEEPAAEAESEEAFEDLGNDLLLLDRIDRSPVEPSVHIEYPDRVEGQQPDWLEKEPWSDDEGQEFVPVTADVQTSKLRALSALEERIKQEADDYLDRLLGSSGAASQVGYRTDELNSRCVVHEPFVERVLGTYTTWQAHALLKFDESFQNDAMGRWRRVRATHRLAQTGLGAGVVLLVLSTLCGYFRLDTATRGYYTTRLQFATAGTILALAAASLLVLKWWGPWM
jgi:hypothetical protein